MLMLELVQNRGRIEQLTQSRKESRDSRGTNLINIQMVDNMSDIGCLLVVRHDYKSMGGYRCCGFPSGGYFRGLYISRR